MAWTDQSLAGGGTVAHQLKCYSYYEDSLADDGTITLPVCTDGAFGYAQFGDNAVGCIFSYTAAGAVTLNNLKGTAASTDSDGSYCIYDGGTSPIVKNRIGAAAAVKVLLFYS